MPANDRRLKCLTIGNVLFWEPAHWIMQTPQFAKLKQRAERASTTDELWARTLGALSGPRAERGQDE
jgi:hypothetical protein